MTLTQRRAKPFSPFPAGYLHYPCFLLWVFNTFPSEFPTVSNSEQLCAVRRSKEWHSSSWAAAPAASSEWETEGLDRLGSRHFNTTTERVIPQVFLHAPHFWENVLYTPTGSGQPEFWPGGKASINPYFLFWRGHPKPPKESLECPYSRAMCALQPVPAACKQNINPLEPGNAAFFWGKAHPGWLWPLPVPASPSPHRAPCPGLGGQLRAKESCLCGEVEPQIFPRGNSSPSLLEPKTQRTVELEKILKGIPNMGNVKIRI